MGANQLLVTPASYCCLCAEEEAMFGMLWEHQGQLPRIYQLQHPVYRMKNLVMFSSISNYLIAYIYIDIDISPIMYIVKTGWFMGWGLAFYSRPQNCYDCPWRALSNLPCTLQILYLCFTLKQQIIYCLYSNSPSYTKVTSFRHWLFIKAVDPQVKKKKYRMDSYVHVIGEMWTILSLHLLSPLHLFGVIHQKWLMLLQRDISTLWLPKDRAVSTDTCAKHVVDNVAHIQPDLNVIFTAVSEAKLFLA